jgi:predicted RNA binding protein YcfA (HicA-like mRNA interferase family)
LPKLPRITPKEAEEILFASGFIKIRGKGSHRVYMKDDKRIVIPFHSGKTLHPKIVKQVFSCIENNNNE